jgi:predicted dehydrogenase
MSPEPIKVAVVGVGYLGRFHAQKFSRLPGVELAAVVDADPARAEEVGREVGAPAFTDHRRVLELVDAASVVTPTVSHHRVALDLLEAGKDVFCEKPLASTLAEADEMVAAAERGGRVLQVGHLERFNPAVEDMLSRAEAPLFIECNRIAPFKARATDVDVALDLMIHDLDIILALVGAEPSEVRAVGVPVLGSHADIVNARLEFPGGCVANVTASRLALKDERKMRVFQPSAYLNLDFKKRKLLVVSGVEFAPGKKPKVQTQRPRYPKTDPLEKELSAFVECVRTRACPRVSGEDGRRALACALEVARRVRQSLAGREELPAAAKAWVDARTDGEG